MENLDAPGNPGNFLRLLNLLSEHDNILQSHLDLSTLHTATYLALEPKKKSLRFSANIILNEIIGEIKAEKFYSVLADEVTSHNTEHLSLCAWFVDSKKVGAEINIPHIA